MSLSEKLECQRQHSLEKELDMRYNNGMNTEQLLQAQREFEKEDAIYESIDAAMHKHNAEFEAKWPNHCKKCGGWGLFSYSQSVPYGSTSASFEVQDPCEALPERVCHRCGKEGLTYIEEGVGEGPCRECGWNFDDGLAS